MFYLIQFHLIWMLLALLLGLAIGWVTCAATGTNGFGGWVLPASVILVAAIPVSFLKLLPGRWGYALDLALLMFTVYILGCCVGCWLKSRQQQQQEPASSGLDRTHSGSTDGALPAQLQPAAGSIPGSKPPMLVAPTGNLKDDLTAIQGIGPIHEQSLNRLGIFHFCQIADWTNPEVTWVSHALALPGRIERERWVDQAKILCKGDDTDYSRQVKSKIITADDAALDESALSALAAALAAATHAPAPDTAAAARAGPSPVAAETGSLPPETIATASAIPPAPVETSKTLDAAKAMPSLQSTPTVPQPSPAPAHVDLPIPASSAQAQAVSSADGTARERAPPEAAVDDAAAYSASAAPVEMAGPAAASATELPGEKSSDLSRSQSAAAAAGAAMSHPGRRPVALATAAGGVKDDLKWIKGIGPKNERALNELGIFHFCQIAEWTAAEATWVGHHLVFPGRIERELWLDQAKLLCGGIDTEHSRAVRAGLVASDDAPMDAAEAERLKAALPQPMPPVGREEAHEGRRPLGLARPCGTGPDDLQRIKGIGPRNEGRLHDLGIWHFDQIANWSPDNVRWVSSYLAFSGRIDREQWIAQAKQLAAGGPGATSAQDRPNR